MKQVCILGSTGSIGQNSLEVIKCHSRDFRVSGLSTKANTDILYEQIKFFHPDFACVTDVAAGLNLKRRLKGKKTRLLIGKEGLGPLVADNRIDLVLLAISGAAALAPLLKAIDNGKDIALANKEALVMAGPIIMGRAKSKNVRILPIDSEQSAIWQCLHGQDRNRLKNIYLTASGGPLRTTTKKDFQKISVKEVLNHPRWRMGRKITVDSATLMNKGFEVLEAMHLFGIGPDKIKIVIHPEAIIHSMVEFIDGVIIAQLSATDMRIPIQYALTYPERLPAALSPVDFYKLRSFNFYRPDFKKFPCLGLAYRAAKDMGTAPCVMNAANEVSVDGFLKGRLAFTGIPAVIEKVLSRHRNIRKPGLNDILNADAWAREESRELIG
ncbi:MAG: 1-deoxy-D-xylulose-5-phosphate reductoisomerase [Deltaproteobacteria bacterium]